MGTPPKTSLKGGNMRANLSKHYLMGILAEVEILSVELLEEPTVVEIEAILAEVPTQEEILKADTLEGLGITPRNEWLLYAE